MTLWKNTYGVAVMLATLILQGCGVAHTKTDIQSKNLSQYKNIYIREVNVFSNETSAKSNEPLQKKLADWAKFTREELEQYVRDSDYTLVNSATQNPERTLISDIDVNVVYGNRALRWAVGFGAGKGGVDSILTLRDAATGVIQFQAKADSDLSVGGAGGDIDDVLKSNIRSLVEQYRESRNEL